MYETPDDEEMLISSEGGSSLLFHDFEVINVTFIF